mgnify:CR=1 FL=1
MKLNRPTCSFCGANEGDCHYLIQNNKTFICDQCVRAISTLLKANPGRTHLRYLPKWVNKKNR